MPTDMDVKPAEDLFELRVDIEKRFATIDSRPAVVGRGLTLIRWIGVFFAGIATMLVCGAISVSCSASALNSQARFQGDRLEKVESRLEKIESRLDTMARSLDMLISRTAPAPQSPN